MKNFDPDMHKMGSRNFKRIEPGHFFPQPVLLKFLVTEDFSAWAKPSVSSCFAVQADN